MKNVRNVIALVVIAIILVGITAIVTEIRNFRRTPRYRVLNRYLSSSLPHHVIGRFAILYPGSDTYNVDVSNWCMHNKNLSDNCWNRYLLERLVKNLPPAQLGKHLAIYPLTPTNNLTHSCLRVLYPTGGVSDNKMDSEKRAQWASVLDLLQRIPNTSEVVNDLIKSQVVKPKDTYLFVAVASTIIKYNQVDWTALVAQFWPILDSYQRYDILKSIGENIKSVESIDRRLISFIRIAINEESSDLCMYLSVVGRLCATKATKGEALNLLNLVLKKISKEKAVNKPVYIEGCAAAFLSNIEPAQKLEFAKLVFEKTADYLPKLADDMFHEMIHLDIIQAERIFLKHFSSGDSTLRKAMIVRLICHESHVGMSKSESAFQGQAPRVTRFSGNLEYVYGSKITEAYERISGHKYLGVGKYWPPFQTGSRDETTGWQQFIAKYPWHPGTDDAYYRLLYALASRNEFETFWKTAEEYYSKSHPDIDSNPYIAFLLRETVLKHPPLKNDSEMAKHIWNLVHKPLAFYITEEEPDVWPYIDSLTWFRADELRLSALGIDQETAELSAKIMLSIRDNSKAKRLQMITELMNKRRYALSFYTIFYGLSFVPRSKNDVLYSTYQAICARRAANRMSTFIMKELGFSERYNLTNYFSTIMMWVLLHASDSKKAEVVAPELHRPFDMFNLIDIEKFPPATREKALILKELSRME